MRPARPATFVPTSGKRRTSSFAASTMSTTTGSGSYSTATSSAASTPVARSGLTTTATMSPTKRTTSLATTGRLIRCSSTGIGGGPVVTSMSSPVKTCTSGSASAADVSTPTTRACARSERTNVTVSAPSSGRFSTYVASPRRKRGSSFRSTRFPRMLIQPSLSSPDRAFNSAGQDNLSIRFSRPSAAERRSHGSSHVAPCGQVRVFERGAEGNGRERGADPPDRRVELVERGLPAPARRSPLRSLRARPPRVRRRAGASGSPSRRSSRGRVGRACADRSPRPRSRLPRAPRRRRPTPSTRRERATTVTSRPGRTTRARPMGTGVGSSGTSSLRK